MKICPEKLTAVVKAAQASDPELKIRDIGDAAGFTESRVYQLMRGVGGNINPRIGEALAKFLKCKTKDISKELA